jgi:DNA (cytosine-5)-methyltransferase 1
MNHVSLFSGIGGIDIAAHQAGMQTVAFVEQNKFCQQVLAKHWPNVPIFDDVKTFKKGDISESVNIISAGFPCQPYSVAGKQLAGKDDRALWHEVDRIIEEFEPDWFVGENVIGLISLALDDVLASLEAHGYTTRAFVIPACAVGARHIRERVFIVGHTDSDRLQRIAKTGNSEQTQIAIIQRREIAGADSLRRSDRSRWEYEPDVGRVAYGVPNRMDRLKSLGNAVVPQQVFPIMQAIMEIEAMT